MNLIDNAIQAIGKRGKIFVRSSFLSDRNAVRVEVADDGPGLDLKYGRMPKGGGVGVSNCRERLKELYGNDQSFRLGTTDPHGLTISILLPVTRAQKQDEHT